MDGQIILPHETTPLNLRSNEAPANYYRAAPRAFKEPQADFVGILRILLKRKGIILKTTVGIFALAVAYTFLSTPRFRSESNIEFNKQNSDSLALDEQRLGDANALDYIVTQQTQVKTLLSDTLAIRVIKELNLEALPELSKKPFLGSLFKTNANADEGGLPLERAPRRRVKILNAFHKNLTVTPVAGTRLINIQYMNPDPQVSARVVNTLVKDYRDQYFQNRYSATMEASGWLSKQLADLKAEVEASQHRLADYQRGAGILGTDESHNIIMTRLGEVDKQLMDAEANRIVTHTVAQLVREGSPELVSGLIGGGPVGTSSSMSPLALTQLQSLRAEEGQLKMEYAEAATQYGSANPKLLELKSKMNQLDETIQQEIQNLSARAQNDYVAAQQNETALRSVFENEKEQANQLNDSAVQYTILKQEVESNRTLYDGLLQKFKEAGVLAGLRTSNIVVVDEALPSDRPARPIVLLNLGLGMMAGLLCGVGAGFIAENIDDTINTSDDTEDVASLQTLGVVPTWKLPDSKRVSKTSLRTGSRDSGICVISHSRSQPAEVFRAIRTAILNSTRRGVSTSIMVTSASPGEGKSTVSLNCAAAFAQQGARVLLVEADMRRPVLKNLLKLDASSGLSSIVRGESCPELPIKLPYLPKLSVIPAGPETSFPADLLGSERMKELIVGWSAEYDYVFFDSPPALTVTDAVVLASHIDLVVLVARSKVTRRQSLLRVCNLLGRTHPRILGVVLNGCDASSKDFGEYYGYNSHHKLNAGYYESLPK